VVDVSAGEVLGTVESSRAFSTVHDGAVYLHLGRSYEVRELDLPARRALVVPFDGGWYTQPKKETMTEIEQLLDRRETLGVTLSFGRVTVTEQVLAYQRKRLPDHEVLDLQALDLPETTFATQALWYELDDDLLADDFPLDALLGALHAAEHGPDRRPAAAGHVRPLGHRRACRRTSTPRPAPDDLHLRRPPGRRRHHAPGLLAFETLVADAYRLISECPCESGCPSCVQSPKCGNLNEPLSKAGAAEVMARMLER
jgi:DEAD/DEAH box helicase domain-containing protein